MAKELDQVESTEENAAGGSVEETAVAVAAAPEPTDTQKTVKVRKQNTKDFWLLLRIIQKGGKEAFSRLQEAEGESQHIMVFLDVGMEFAERELKEFLAGLADMTVEAYDAGDFDLTMTIAEKWEEQEDLAGFFRRAVNFIKKFSAKN